MWILNGMFMLLLARVYWGIRNTQLNMVGEVRFYVVLWSSKFSTCWGCLVQLVTRLLCHLESRCGVITSLCLLVG